MKIDVLRNRGSGFTLIEVMIVVVIIAIILMIAVPSYSRHICKVERGQAKGDLLAFAQAMESFYSTNNFRYRTSGGALPNVFPSYSPADGSSTEKDFDLALTVPNDGKSFSISATRSAGSCQDGTLNITSSGDRTWVRGGVTQTGWQE